jgi:hypothetical protein
MISVNTQYFREAALYHEKHGCYDDGIFDSYHYHEYWDREMYRVKNGYEVGGMRITGDHYWYLNYSPIMVTKKNKDTLYKQVTNNRVQGSRELAFPSFWDEDFHVWNEIELCEKNGQHFLWLKPRGVGASYKGAAKASKNFFTIKRSKTYMLASSSEFLTGDGLYSKFLSYRQFINLPHPDEDRYRTAFGKPSDYKKDINDMHFRASTNVNGEERGYMSEVMGITMKDDIQKARGKRGNFMLLEEMGAFPNVEKVFNIARSSFEEGPVVYGLIWGFGTGGTEASDFGDMEKMFYNPESYNIRCYNNEYDEGMQGTKCAYFTTAAKDIAFIDKNGNSLQDTARKYYEGERTKALKSPDQNAIIQIKAEKPFSPQEAILRTTYSVLPSNEALDWYHKVISTGIYNMGVNGELINSNGEIKFEPKANIRPVDKFPHNIKDDLTGCVTQYYAPFKVNGRVPDGLYIIAHDPYAYDSSTDMESIGATYVYMQPNNLVPPGDKIVATYFGRPKTTDDYNKILFMLSQYYNAKIGFENDRGDVIGYAKRFKMLDRLAEEFELAFDSDLPKSKVRRNYGMHIGSGKDNLRKNKGDKYLSDWLITPRGKDEDGNVRWNLHTIPCPTTLKEISMYRPDGGNFDRISALRILAYYQKELVYKDVKPTVSNSSPTGFFNKRHF